MIPNMAKKLTKKVDTKMLGGVISGIADYFNQDPTLLRVAVVALAILTGILPVVIFYLVAWFIMPDGGTDVEYTVVD